MLMTKDLVVESCKRHGGYRQPHLNDQLYLHCRGFCNIDGLDEFVNAKVLWLEQNAITVIEGLGKLKSLVTLFLHNNAIREINTGLSTLANLRTLNLSHNGIYKIENLSCCPVLETLQLSHNRIGSLRDCEHLWECRNLSCIDLSFNMLEREEGQDDMVLVRFFEKMPEVSVLYLHGNDLSRGIKMYRKNLVLHLKKLTYLDELPVFPEERRTTEAWGAGGADGERAERQRIYDEKQEQLARCTQVTREMWEKNKEERERRTREWDAKQAEERAEQTARYQTYFKEQEEFTEAADQAYWDLLAEENQAFAAFLRAWEPGLERARQMESARIAQQEADAEESARRIAAELELEREENLRAEAIRAKNLSEAAERQAWIDRFIEEDKVAEETLHAHVEQMLAALIPGQNAPLTPEQLQQLAPPLRTVPKHVAQSALHADPANSLAAAKAPSAQQKSHVQRKDIWEKYYQFEKRGSRRL